MAATPSDDVTARRWRALLIRYKIRKSGPGFQNELEDEFLDTLRLHCDVVVVEQDFDFAELCDTVEPDFVILDSPRHRRPEPVRIANWTAHGHIPRVAFQAQDPHDTARPTFFRQLDELGIERIFCLCTAQIEHAPELEGRAFTLGLCFDDRVYKEYGQEKIIPVSVFGGAMSPGFYAWRAEQLKSLADHFPTLVYTHPGYGSTPIAHRFPIAGEAYARMINRSHFSLSDTSRLHYAVRKHLEIPAAGTVLISPDVAGVAHYGFRDMENCILGSGRDLFEKIAAAASDPALYERLRANGHRLVHSRFRRENWRGIVDWYECFRSLKPGEMVQQQGVFGPYKAVPAVPGRAALNAGTGNNEFTVRMETARRTILQGGDLQTAAQNLLPVTEWLGHMTEPHFLLGIVALLQGQPAEAQGLLKHPYEVRMRRQEGLTLLDPVEVAWLWLTAVLIADEAMARLMEEEAGRQDHLALRRVRWLIASKLLSDPGAPPPDQGLFERRGTDRLSVHWIGQEDFGDWFALIQRILEARRTT
jgi:hypothetical protein